jgi:hypothetical protein
MRAGTGKCGIVRFFAGVPGLAYLVIQLCRPGIAYGCSYAHIPNKLIFVLSNDFQRLSDVDFQRLSDVDFVGRLSSSL